MEMLSLSNQVDFMTLEQVNRSNVETNSKLSQPDAQANQQQNSTNINDLKQFPQMYVLSTSMQITLNNSIIETIKYLKTYAKDKKKEIKFGDLWKIINVTNEDSEQNPYNGELLEFEISKYAKNIFAA